MASRSSAAHLVHLAATPLALWSLGCVLVSTCVAAGTRVATPYGWIAVEALRPGDAVLAVDVATGALIEATVAAVRRGRRECLALACAGDELRVTPDHPVYAPELGGFVEAGRIALGQVKTVMRVADPGPGARAVAAAVGACSTYAGVFEVYDLTLAGDHPTFVAEGFVVHNKSTATGGGSSGGSTAGTMDASASEAGTASEGTASEPTGGDPGTASGSGGTTADASSGDGTDSGGATFPCGPNVCALAAEYCEVFIPGVPDGMTSYSCVALPPACLDAPTCDCLAAEGVPGRCSTTPEGGLKVELAAP